MKRFQYQSSAYGHPWALSEEADTLSALARYMSPFWLKMLSERHHRIVDTSTGEVVWEKRSKIAPEPNSKEGV